VAEAALFLYNTYMISIMVHSLMPSVL